MPRVSEDHLTARREQVLLAAWACFSRNGFHATTMADVIAESGLSAGAVYRYFPGKADLVRATADRALGQVGGRLNQLLESGEVVDPVDALGLLLEVVEHIATTEPTDITRIALMAWAESLRAPEIRDITSPAMGSLRAGLAQLATRARDAGRLPPATDPEAVAQATLSLGIGWIVQRLIAGVVDREAYLTGVRALLQRTAAPTPG